MVTVKPTNKNVIKHVHILINTKTKTESPHVLLALRYQRPMENGINQVYHVKNFVQLINLEKLQLPLVLKIVVVKKTNFILVLVEISNAMIAKQTP